MKTINILEEQAGQRFDKFLIKYFNNAGKSFVYKMLRKKRIKLNGKKAEGNEILIKNDCINMYISDETINILRKNITIEKSDMDFSIVYEDENIIICNKPKGLIVHPDNTKKSNTLNDQLIYYIYKKDEYNPKDESAFTPSICNRLDTNTSGIVLFAKTLGASQALNFAIKNNLINKYYKTIVYGNVNKKGIMKGYHIKNDLNKVVIYENFIEGSKEVFTKYKPLKFAKEFTLLQIKLITGKSHQIRAGLMKEGFPIVGDVKYGNKLINNKFKEKYGLSNQLLHAECVVFNNMPSKLSYLNSRKFIADTDNMFKKIEKDIFGNI